MNKAVFRSDGLYLALLADANNRMIVEYLLDGPATQRELRDELGLQVGSISRQMRALEDAALVVRERSHGPYELTFPVRTRAVLQAAADLAREISDARSDADGGHSRDLRKGGMRVSIGDERREGA